MKKLTLSFIIVLLLLTLSSCNFDFFITMDYRVKSEYNRYVVTVGEELDLKSLFTVEEVEMHFLTIAETREIPVTDDMIIAPEADLTREGTFTVTCTTPQKFVYKTVMVVVKGSGGSAEPSPDPSAPEHKGSRNDPYTVADACFVLNDLTLDNEGNASTEKVYVKGTVTQIGPRPSEDDSYYFGDPDRCYTYIELSGDNSYLPIKMTISESIWDTELKLGDTVLVYGSLTVSNYLDKHMGTSYYHDELPVFSIVRDEIPEKMPAQVYDESAHTPGDDILNDAIRDYIDQAPGSRYVVTTGLVPQGKQDVLVIPIQFADDKFTEKELRDLELVLNGTEEQTGWNSVSSYYRKSSYGKLDLSFDIQETPVTMPMPFGFYGNLTANAADILQYALAKIEPSVDLSKYDTDKDGYIDAVYLIYSAPVQRSNDILYFYWAFVSRDLSSRKYDGVRASHYLFAGIDFIYDNTEESEEKPIDGLLLNASVYIHETGHMLGLDDYYDYYDGSGSDEGLGNADMMDYNAGDHNAYSKLLLGWVTPTVVTSTQTVTIDSFTESGEFIMVLLDYDGTYFSEYLIIDLYTATGLNAMHAGIKGTFLYDGETYGARIYHVSSSVKMPFCNDRYSFTDNENSSTRIPLIKLVEADGDHNFESDTYTEGGYDYRFASYDDLWQSGSSLSQMHPNYTRNDGKLINFDISFDSVTEDSAAITITFD